MFQNKINIFQTTSIWKWFVVFLLVLNSCSPDLSKIKPPEDISNLPQITVKNFSAYYKISSKLKVELKAPLMYKYTISDNKVEFPEGVHIKFYDDNFNIITTLKCKNAINYPKKNLWKFSKDVEVKNIRGGVLKTQELFFDQKNQKIYSVKFVEVADEEGTVIRGKGGFEANYDFSIYEFKNVDGIINLNKSGL